MKTRPARHRCVGCGQGRARHKGKRGGRKVYRHDKDHDLCPACADRELSRNKARKLLEQLELTRVERATDGKEPADAQAQTQPDPVPA